MTQERAGAGGVEGGVEAPLMLGGSLPTCIMITLLL